jgi:hypothetical protein
MASSGKRKTTMAKLTRESRLRDRRVVKAAKKDARKRAAADGTTLTDAYAPADDYAGQGFTGDALTSDALIRDDR